MSSHRDRGGTGPRGSGADGRALQCPSCWYQSRVDWMQRGGLVWYDSSYFKRRSKTAPADTASAPPTIAEEDKGNESVNGLNLSSTPSASSPSGGANPAADSIWCQCIVWNWPFFASSTAPGWRLESCPEADESYIIYPIEEPAGCWCWLAPVCCLYSACVDSASALFVIQSRDPVLYSSSPEPRQHTLRCELRTKSAASEDVVDYRDFITKAEVQLVGGMRKPQAK
jgi:hypothetical protein